VARFDGEGGEYQANGARFAIVASRFNADVVDALRQGAIDALMEHGAETNNIAEIEVPGAFELPLVVRRAAQSGRYDAVIAIGAVIRGGTPHFEYIAGECTRGLAQVALEVDLPVIFGVLTVDTMEQALERCGGSHGNKGREAALAALEMVHVLRNLPQ